MTKKEEKNKTTKIKEEKVKTTKTKETTKKNASAKKKNTKTQNVKKTTKKPFLKEVNAELKKVRWPLKKEMITYSIATLVFMLILGLFFVATDLIIAGIRMVFI